MAIPIRRDSARIDAPRDVAPLALVPRSRWSDITLSALRIMAGLMLAQHGVQKFFGWLAPPDRPFQGAPALLSQTWIAASLELVGGLLVAVGLFTRPVAFVLSGLMAFAYFMVHAPRGFWPVLNGGELAALYCFVFLALSGVGGGPYGLDRLLRRRRPDVTRPAA